MHGWFGPGAAWQPPAPFLNLERFTYCFPDLRGYGARAILPGEHTISEAAGDVIALADTLGLDRFSSLGHSMGGGVMQRVLADTPGRVRALVGVSPAPANGIAFDDASWDLFCAPPGDSAARRAIIDFTTGGRLPAERLDAMVEHSVRTSDAAALGAYLEAWARTGFHTEIEGSPVPVEVIVGRHDPAVGADLARPRPEASAPWPSRSGTSTTDRDQ